MIGIIIIIIIIPNIIIISNKEITKYFKAYPEFSHWAGGLVSQPPKQCVEPTMSEGEALPWLFPHCRLGKGG